MEGNTDRGASSPAKPALHIPEPLSTTRAATSSDIFDLKVKLTQSTCTFWNRTIFRQNFTRHPSNRSYHLQQNNNQQTTDTNKTRDHPNLLRSLISCACVSGYEIEYRQRPKLGHISDNRTRFMSMHDIIVIEKRGRLSILIDKIITSSKCGLLRRDFVTLSLIAHIPNR